MALMNQCWEWTGYKQWTGYGQVRINGKVVGPHRAAYEVIMGPIPAGLEIDHLCNNRGCYNPYHMEPVTHADNLRRIATRRGVCKNGLHSLENNTVTLQNGSQGCRACRVEQRRRAYRKRVTRSC